MTRATPSGGHYSIVNSQQGIHVCSLPEGSGKEGQTYIGIFLDLNGRFYAVFFRPKGKISRRAHRFVHNCDILRKVFWRISALVLKDHNERLYANDVSGVNACIVFNTR